MSSVEQFRRELQSVGPESAVYLFAGAASMCWENPAGAGEFDSERARELGDAFLVQMKEWLR